MSIRHADGIPREWSRQPLLPLAQPAASDVPSSKVIAVRNAPDDTLAGSARRRVGYTTPARIPGQEASAPEFRGRHTQFALTFTISPGMTLSASADGSSALRLRR